MEIQTLTNLQVGLLLMLILLNIPFSSLFAIIIVVVIESKKMMTSTFCKVDRDLTGKVAIVTGGNSGIGKQTVYALAQKGCQVIVAARDEKKSNAVVNEINAKIGSENTHSYFLNLSSKKQIDSFVQKIKQKYNKVDFLINNAGVMMLPQRKLTDDGFQMQMGVNHLGHFYLTFKLWDLLKKSQDLRIVNVSSSAHYKVLKKVQIDYSNFLLQKDYGPMKAYGSSKLANVLFTQQLAERLSKYNPAARCVTLHPGFVRTQIPRYIRNSNSIISYAINPVSLIFGKTPLQGAQTSIYTILQESSKLQNGAYYNNCLTHPKNPFASKKQNQQRLWQISEQLLGIKFTVQ